MSPREAGRDPADALPATLKIAVTARAAFILTVHVRLPEHAPVQRAKVDPAEGVAVSVTVAPTEKDAVHVEPHEIPAGADVTVPAPVPVLDTVSGTEVALGAKVAVTQRASVIETVQRPVPEHARDQPVKVDPAAALAVRVTLVPEMKVVRHVEPQLIPDGDDDTVPEPSPDLVTASGLTILVGVS